MKLKYKNKKIEKICSNENIMVRTYGAQVTDKLIMALDALEYATNLKDILVLHFTY